MVGEVRGQFPDLEILEPLSPDALVVLVRCDCVDEPGATILDQVVDAFGPDETTAEPMTSEGFASAKLVKDVLA